jgi:hypothetical protein
MTENDDKVGLKSDLRQLLVHTYTATQLDDWVFTSRGGSEGLNLENTLVET